MDYLGWELERQRNALAALLLGGGEARKGERAWEEERRSPEESGAVRGDAAGLAGRYAGGRSGDAGGPGYTRESAYGTLGRRETARVAGTGRIPEAAERPVSAWEEIQGAGRDLARGGWDAEAGGPDSHGRGASRKNVYPPDGGTGVPAEFLGPSGGDVARWEARSLTEEDVAAGRAGRGRTEERSGERWSGPGEDAGVAASETEYGGEGAAGGGWHSKQVIDGGPSGALRQWRAVSRGGGGGGRAPEQDGLPDGMAWGGGRETAVLQAEDGARALSRAVQRDARRYDGGFSIY